MNQAFMLLLSGGSHQLMLLSLFFFWFGDAEKKEGGKTLISHICKRSISALVRKQTCEII
jgi:hypothetical protein